MPRVGEPCSAPPMVTLSDGGDVLVCRDGFWQRPGEDGPLVGEELPDREAAQELIERRFGKIDHDGE